MKGLLRRVRRDDEGAVLIMAMLFFLLMASVVLAPLAMADVNLRSTVSLHQDRAVQYAAADILDATIATYQSSSGGGYGQFWQSSWASCASYGLPTGAPFTLTPSGLGGQGTWNGETLQIACTALQPGANMPQTDRHVEFAVCVPADFNPSTGTCSNPLLTAEVFLSISGSPTVWVTTYSMNY